MKKALTMIAILAIVATGCTVNTGGDEPGGYSRDITEDVATPCIDKAAAGAAATKAGAALESAMDDVGDLNIQGAAVNTALAAEYTRDSAAAAVNAPEVADELYAAADAYEGSADALSNMKIESATALMGEANTHMNTATALVKSGDYADC